MRREVVRVSRVVMAGVIGSGLLVTPVSPVYAWGDEGHRAVALVAQQMLASRKPQTLVALRAILGNAPLASVATCPDELRARDRNPKKFRFSTMCQRVFGNAHLGKTDDWHFIDLDVLKAVPTRDLTMDQDFCANEDCVVAKILAFHKVLANAAAPDRLQALAFVVHFVGDIHQPLHAAERNNDHGGNGVLVSLSSAGRHPVTEEKLHGAWDSTFIRAISGDETAFVASIGTEIAAAQREQIPLPAQFPAWVHNWARSSERLAVERAYQDVGKPLPMSGHVLSQGYEDTAEATVQQQIAIAGVRLAALLASAFPQ